MNLNLSIECANEWHSKIYGVIFVKRQEDIDILYKLLSEQDDYWIAWDMKHLIKVLPKSITQYDLDNLCEYVGKVDIYNVKEIKNEVDFFIYQRWKEDF